MEELFLAPADGHLKSLLGITAFIGFDHCLVRQTEHKCLVAAFVSIFRQKGGKAPTHYYKWPISSLDNLSGYVTSHLFT